MVKFLEIVFFKEEATTRMHFPWKVTAVQEYEKDPKLKRDDVSKIQEWMKSLGYLPIVDDEMICNFLFACFYDVDQAKKTIETYYTYKTTMPDFFDNWDPTEAEIQETVNNIIIAAPLPRLTKEGYKMIVCKLNDTSPEKFVYPACVKWMLMSCTYSLWENGITKGYVIVYDASGYTMSHLLKCSLSNVRNYINYGKNASPIRVVKIVFINTSPVIKKLITIVKPFLNKELVNMMAFYTSADSFFEEMTPETVPEDYGGSAPPLLSLHRESAKKIISVKQWLIDEEKIRIDVAKKNAKPRKDSIKVENSFRNLEID